MTILIELYDVLEKTNTYATFRIEEGAPHYLIAQNMGTSIEMLEKHYVKLAMTAVGHEITRMRPKISTPS